MSAALSGDFNTQEFTDLGVLASSYRLYTYTAGTTTLKTAYTDAAASVPHTYTSDGIGGQYIALNARGELPAPLFLTPGPYDIALKSPAGVTVWTRRAAATGDEVRTDVADATASGVGAGMVGFGPTIAYTTGVGSILRYFFGKTAAETSAGVTPSNYGYPPGDVRRYGADSTGATSSKAAFQAAFAANKTVIIPDGTWDMGSLAGGTAAVDLTALGDGITIVTAKNALLRCTTTGSPSTPYFFHLDNNNNFTCGDISFQDLGYDNTVTWKGAIAFYVTNATPVSWGNINIRSIKCKTLVAPIEVQSAGHATLRIRGIKIGHIDVDDCYYGLSLQNDGDGVVVDLITANQAFRPMFVYGVSGVRANIVSRQNRSTSGAVNISRSVGGKNTRDIKVNYTSRDNSNAISHVLVNHIDLLGGEITDLDINVNIESAAAGYNPVRFVNYNGSGVETAAASPNVVDRIQIDGQTDANDGGIGVTASYGRRGVVDLRLNNTTIPPAAVTAAFSLGQSISVTPTWSSSGVAPVLGNGTLTQTYAREGNLLHVHTALTIGSTTTFGTGQYSFSLPATALQAASGAVYIKDTSASGIYRGVAFVDAGQNTFQVFSVDNGAPTSSATPMTWATGDRMEATITLRIG